MKKTQRSAGRKANKSRKKSTNSTPAVDRAYYRAQAADDAYQAALDRAGEARWSGKPGKSPAVKKAFARKVKADEAYRDAVRKMREKANPKPKRKKPAAKKRNSTKRRPNCGGDAIAGMESGRLYDVVLSGIPATATRQGDTLTIRMQNGRKTKRGNRR